MTFKVALLKVGRQIPTHSLTNTRDNTPEPLHRHSWDHRAQNDHKLMQQGKMFDAWYAKDNILDMSVPSYTNNICNIVSGPKLLWCMHKKTVGKHQTGGLYKNLWSSTP